MKRKAFNFYSSYYETAKMLDDKNRLAFLDAIIKRQFTGVETDLSKYPMANFAYVSQKFSIDAQILGWESKMKIELSENETITYPSAGASEGASEGGKEGGKEGASVQVQEQVQGKEKVQEQVQVQEKHKKIFMPPKILEVIEYFKEKGYSEQAAKKAFEYYDVADWHDSKGNKVKNWRQKMQSVWFKEENKMKIENPNELRLKDYTIPNEYLMNFSDIDLKQMCKEGKFKRI